MVSFQINSGMTTRPAVPRPWIPALAGMTPRPLQDTPAKAGVQTPVVPHPWIPDQVWNDNPAVSP